METTRVSSKGQVIIPSSIRKNLRWHTGQELVVVKVKGGVLLKPKNPFPPSQLEEVAGCLAYSGPPITVEEMDEAIGKGLSEAYK